MSLAKYERLWALTGVIRFQAPFDCAQGFGLEGQFSGDILECGKSDL
jgi:hypothetical protein